MGAVTSGELRVEAGIPIRDILEFEMKVEKDHHAFIHLHGIVGSTSEEFLLFQQMEQDTVTVMAGEMLLFKGIIKKVDVFRDGEGYEIRLTGISGTSRLDYYKKNRTFQDQRQTFEDVMSLALMDTPGAGVRMHVENRKTDIPLFQIEETDWSFLKRLASAMSVSIFPETRVGKPGIHIGLPQGKTLQWEKDSWNCEKIWRDNKSGALCRKIKTWQNGEIGDRFILGETEYWFTKKSCRLEKGLLYFTYVISDKSVCVSPCFGNEALTGRLLPGIITDTKEEQVRVKFHVDSGAYPEDSFWYPWVPDVGNIMYCMPEKGEKVYVLLGDPMGKDAKAFCGVHQNGAGNPEMIGSDRIFTTKEKKRMFLNPEVMGFQDLNRTSPLEAKISDEDGISLVSRGKIVISAAETIGLKGKHLFFQAPSEISIVRRNLSNPTVINLCNGFDSVGVSNAVTMSGSGDGGFPVFSEPEADTERTLCLDGMARELTASVPGVRFEEELEKQVAAVWVDSLIAGIGGSDE